jgi:hypothetical protein
MHALYRLSWRGIFMSYKFLCSLQVDVVPFTWTFAITLPKSSCPTYSRTVDRFDAVHPFLTLLMTLLGSRILGIFRLKIEDQLPTFRFSDSMTMNPILESRMCGNSMPNETSVSATIAQYLVEHSPTFKELTDLRQKVSEKEARHQERCSHAFRVEDCRGRSVFRKSSCTIRQRR